MPLDVATLFFALVLVTAMAAGFLWFLNKDLRAIPGARPMTLGYTCLVIGYLAISLRPSLPAFLSFIVANALICLGYVLALHGVAGFFGRWISIRTVAALVLGYSAAFSFYYYAIPWYEARLEIYLCFYATVMAGICRLTLGGYERTRLRSHLVATSVAAFLSGSFLVCAVLVLVENAGEQILSASAVNALVLIEQIAFVVGWALSFTLMASERLHAEKARAERANRE